MWVGKFETTGTGDEPTILPNNTALTNQNVSTQFATAQKFETYLSDKTDTDSHMMKNSEWGAVAYLSQSAYGKYGNSDYSGANKEVYQNKSDSFTTGSSNGTPGTNTTNTQCSYNDITDRGNGTGSCGGGASTTGNIYGVYDMSGGADERVMGYYEWGADTWGSAENPMAFFPEDETEYNGAGFISKPALRYFDAYTSATSSTACNGKICYGHATSEVLRWYVEGGLSSHISDEPWVNRGRNYFNVSSLFAAGNNSGYDYDFQSFRSVLISAPDLSNAIQE